ncbi:hypothetical protein DFH06DRAFT_1325936 [Mycena polygramma]|nr:hypothetical protein DFH06DRAFT_1325936 [Mycena polygramma]
MSSSSASSNGNGEQHQQPIPVLAPADVQHAISLIQAAYAPSAATDLPQLQSLQSALLAMQRTPAAWGLVVPLLAHEDADLQSVAQTHAEIGVTIWWDARWGSRACRGVEETIPLSQRKIELRPLSYVLSPGASRLYDNCESLDVSPVLGHLWMLWIFSQVGQRCSRPQTHWSASISAVYWRAARIYSLGCLRAHDIVRADALAPLIMEPAPGLEGDGCAVWETPAHPMYVLLKARSPLRVRNPFFPRFLPQFPLPLLLPKRSAAHCVFWLDILACVTTGLLRTTDPSALDEDGGGDDEPPADYSSIRLGLLMPSYSLLVHSCEGVTWARRKAPNLYVAVHQGQSVQRTTVIKRDLAPKWDFLCNLSLESPIALRLWHDSLLRCRDVCLGVAHTDIASLLDLPSSDTEFIRLRLISEDRQSSGTPAGTVLVRLMGQREAVTTALANAQQDLAKLTLGSALTEGTELIENPPLVTETFEAGLSMIISKLDIIIHPYANMAWKILTSVYKAVKREQATEEKLRKLVDTMVAVYSFTQETDILAKKVKNLEDKILAIVKQTVECAVFIREYSGHGFSSRAIRNTGDNIDSMIDSLSETLLKLRDSLESSITVQEVFVSTQVLAKVDRLVQSDALKTLNAAEMNAASRPTCLQGTRVQLLDEISEGLVASEATSSVLWLSGVAGSGKSTITTTISVFFRALHRLGAFLFFDRNNPSRSHPDGVIRTLAYLLARSNPDIASAVSAAIEADPETINAPLQTQFETLLLKPLLAVEHLMQGPMLIILDALDECGDPASRKTLLSVISTEFPKLPSCFRFLITSRREADISKAFGFCFVEKSVGTATSTLDVQRFISHELERIQQDNKLGTVWPKETQKQAMMNLAGGLFIWAATAIKYIDGYRPNDRIETLITSNSTSLDGLYRFTLSKSAPWDDMTFAKDARAVLACIIFGKVPMTDTTIDALLGAGCSSSDTFFLFWIEVLSLLDQVTVASAILDAVVSYVKDRATTMTLRT